MTDEATRPIDTTPYDITNDPIKMVNLHKAISIRARVAPGDMIHEECDLDTHALLELTQCLWDALKFEKIQHTNTLKSHASDLSKVIEILSYRRL